MKNEMFINLDKQTLQSIIEPNFYFMHSILSAEDAARVTIDDAVNTSYNIFQENNKNRPFKRLENQVELVSSTTDCAVAISVVVADAFGVLFQLLGVRQSVIRSATRALLEQLGEDVLRGLRAQIHNIAHAGSLAEKAKEIWTLIKQVKKATGFNGIIKALKGNMKWYDWLLTGATMSAQIGIWFGTDGIAFIAEVALEGVAVGQLVEDAIKVNGACGSEC